MGCDLGAVGITNRNPVSLLTPLPSVKEFAFPLRVLSVSVVKFSPPFARGSVPPFPPLNFTLTPTLSPPTLFPMTGFIWKDELPRVPNQKLRSGAFRQVRKAEPNARPIMTYYE